MMQEATNVYMITETFLYLYNKLQQNSELTNFDFDNYFMLMSPSIRHLIEENNVRDL